MRFITAILNLGSNSLSNESVDPQFFLNPAPPTLISPALVPDTANDAIASLADTLGSRRSRLGD